jgi:Mu-like prophage tail sheath protein gpL
MVSFNNIPNALRVPLFFVEVDNSKANTASEIQRTLIIGQMMDSATIAPNVPVKVSSVSNVAGMCGQGSMIHTMFAHYMANDTMGETWILPLADDQTGMLQATGAITIDTTPSEAGVVSLYIAGVRIQLTVRNTYTKEEIATDLVAKINANASLPVTAAVDGTDGSKINLSAKNWGVCGNQIDLRLNYLGLAGGESMPQGMMMTITPMSGGQGAPDLTEGLSNLQDRAFDFIINPYTDTTSLNDLKDFLSDKNGRWAWDKQLYGHAFSVASGTYGEVSAVGEARNNPHETIWGVQRSLHPNYDLAAAFVGAIAQAIRNDPGRPTQTLKVTGILPPALEDRFNLPERNNLLFSGISTFVVADDDTVQMENTITTYQYNSFGAADDSYLQVETLYLLMYVNRFMRTQVTSKFPRMKLAADGTRFGAGQAIVTPAIIKAELIAQYRTLEFGGYVQDSRSFAQNIIVEKDSQNPNRVNVIWPGTLINQLRIFAVLNQFRLIAE